ncbi:hypothetical protein OG21DRAFT_1486833 [Imleria badia]|nr:hypothetical protein OG21DRAFT_1486833 [Imleria badia]
MSTATADLSLTSLPIETLAEILLYTCSPLIVLAVSRTCSVLYRSQNLQTIPPVPDPGVSGWKKNEADYAAFVFRGASARTKGLAERGGWNLGDLVTSQVYGSLRRHKSFLLEKRDADDVTPIRSDIECELLTMQARQKRQKAEATYRDNLTVLKRIYDRMRCSTPGLSIRRREPRARADPFPSRLCPCFTRSRLVLALKGSPDPSALSASPL